MRRLEPAVLNVKENDPAPTTQDSDTELEADDEDEEEDDHCWHKQQVSRMEAVKAKTNSASSQLTKMSPSSSSSSVFSVSTTIPEESVPLFYPQPNANSSSASPSSLFTG